MGDNKSLAERLIERENRILKQILAESDASRLSELAKELEDVLLQEERLWEEIRGRVSRLSSDPPESS